MVQRLSNFRVFIMSLPATFAIVNLIHSTIQTGVGRQDTSIGPADQTNNECALRRPNGGIANH
jgi:hypothetical protein